MRVYIIFIGADIKEMKDNSFASNIRRNFIGHWNGVAKSRKPLIAAVNGYAVSNRILPSAEQCRNGNAMIPLIACISVS